MTKNELIVLQNLDYELKIERTLLRIREAVSYHGYENLFTCFSGGKDSTVLHYLVKSVDNRIPPVYSKTGLDFPEVVSFAEAQENIIIVKPEKSFRQVIFEEGYPVVSKDVSMKIKRIRDESGKYSCAYLNFIEGKKQDGSNVASATKLAKCHHYLLDAPFKISDECCNILKERPLINYQNENSKIPFIGVMAAESDRRTRSYLKTDCNVYNKHSGGIKPIGFWTEQDVLRFIYENHLEIASVYGDIVFEDGYYYATGEHRTGCIYCPFGVKYDSEEENRFQRLKRTHPRLYDYCLNNLGFKEVFDYVGIKY